MISFINAKIYITFKSILLNLFTRETLRNKGEFKASISLQRIYINELFPTFSQRETPLIFEEKPRGGSWTMNVKGTL